VEVEDVEALQERLDHMRLEVAELQACRRRLVLVADAERREIERELHEGVQQQLVALAVDLQLAEESMDADPAAAKRLIADLARDVERALDEAARLALRIHPPLLEAGGLGAALRSAAARAGVRASLEVATGTRYPPEIAAVVYWCCVEAFQHAGPGSQATVTVRDDEEAVTFEIAERGSSSIAGLERLHDRVEALGGLLTIRAEPGGGARFAGSLPLSG
jgi:signal transduction histidine kinase